MYVNINFCRVFVAVVFEDNLNTALLYVDGYTVTYHNVSSGWIPVTLQFGLESHQDLKISAFHGYVDNIFIYNSKLTVDELDFLRVSDNLQRKRRNYKPIAGNAGSCVHLSKGFALSIPADPLLSGWSSFSMFMWVNVSSILPLSSSATILEKSSVGGKEYALALKQVMSTAALELTIFLGDRTTGCDLSQSSCWSFEWTVDLNAAATEWQHIAVTWNGTFVTCYLNGSFVDQRAWQQSIISDFGSNLMIGSDATSDEGSQLDAHMDTLVFWNTSLSASDVQSLFRMSSFDSLQSESLVAYFTFDENYGLTSSSTVYASGAGNAFQATWQPAFDVSLLSSGNYNPEADATMHWAASTLWLDNHVTTLSTTPVLLRLNASDPLGRSLLYTVSVPPMYGSLYDIRSADSVYFDEFPPLGAKLAINSSSIVPIWVYVPFGNFSGIDKLTFGCSLITDSEDITSFSSISIEIVPAQIPPALSVRDPELVVGPFQVIDRDSWVEGNHLLATSITVQENSSSEIRDDVSVSLTSTQNLYFSQFGGYGTGSKDKSSLFYAEADYVNRAISSLKLSLPDLNLVDRKVELRINVSNNEPLHPLEDSYRTEINLKFSSVPVITDIKPRAVSGNGGVPIDINGAYFGADVILCQIGSDSFPVVRLNNEFIRCILSNNLSAGNYDLSVITSAGLASNVIQITVLADATIDTVIPSSGSAAGGNIVTVYVVAPLPTAPLYCLFGAQYTAATVVDSHKLKCKVPAASAVVSTNMTVDLSLTFNTLEKSSELSSYTYIQDAEFFWTEPSAVAAVAEPQKVVLRGVGLLAKGDACFCKFGDRYVSPLLVISDTIGECNITLELNDKFDNLNQLGFQVAMNGYDYLDTGLSLQLLKSPSLSSLYPDSGATKGGTKVSIVGNNFLRSMKILCVFNGTNSVPALFVSASLLSCESPISQSPGTVSLALSVAGGTVPSLQELNFTYFSYPVNVSVYPPYLVLGSTPFSSEVRLIGDAFMSGSSMQSCVWRDTTLDTEIETPFTLLSLQSAQCGIPALGNTNSSSYDIFINYNDQDFHMVVSNYTILRDIRVDGLSLSYGPSSGGTETFIIGKFYDMPNIFCSFGGSFVAATFMNKSTLLCVTPPYTQYFAPANSIVVLVNVTVVYNFANTVHQQMAVKFYYYKSPHVMSLNPRIGSLVGKTKVVVFGENFNDFGATYCRFGDVKVSALVQNETTLECLSPPMASESKTVSFAISLNGQQFHEPQTEFGYYTSPVITSLSRSFLSSSEEEAIISVYASSIRSGTTSKCVVNGNMVDPVKVVSESIVCSVDIKALPVNASVISLGVSNNGVDIESLVFVPVVGPLSIQYVQPEVVYNFKSTAINVSISTSNLAFQNVSNIKVSCAFNGTVFDGVLNAILNTTTMIVSCSKFPHAIGLYELSIILDGSAVVPTLKIVKVTGQPYFSNVFPASISNGVPSTVVITTLSDLPETFSDTTDLASCILQDRSFPVVFVNSSAISCDIVVHADNTETYLPLEATFNGVDRFYVATLLIQPPNDLIAHPLFGYANSSWRIQISGSNFSVFSGFSCLFGNSLEISGIFMSTNTVLCVKESTYNDRNATFQFLVDGTVALNTSLSVCEEPTISSLYPLALSASGETLYFTTTSQPQGGCDSNPYCIFGDRKIMSEKIANTTFSCQSPTWSTEPSSSFQFSLNGADHSTYSKQLQYYIDPYVSSVSPSFGPLEGNTIIRLQGENLNITNCRFGTIETAAIYSSYSSSSCISPPQATPGKYSLFVSTNGIRYIDTGKVFTHSVRPAAVWMSLSAGPESGGTRVAIHGYDVTNISLGSVFCEFGSNGYRVLGSIEDVNTGTITCVSPNHPPATVPFRISFNGQQFEDINASFTYYLQPTVFEVSPASGSLAGGSKISIFGSNFIASGLLSCKFGDLIVPAQYISNEVLTCISPRVVASSSVIVEMSNNGFDFTSSTVHFTYYTGLSVSTVTPLLVDNSRTNSLEIYLSNASSISVVAYCKFGKNIGRVVSINMDKIVCIAPPSSLVGVAVFQLLRSDLEVLATATIEYFKPLALEKVLPSSSLADGGQIVTIFGSNFIKTPTLVCRFGNLVTTAIYGSNTSIACISPQHSPATVTISVSVNGIDFVDYSIPFQFVDSDHNLAIFPVVVPSSGGSFLSLQSSNLPANSRCRFFDAFESPVLPIPTGRFSCEVPPHSSGVVSFALISDGIVLSKSMQYSLQYVDTPVIESISPALGSTSGNTVVSIMGTNVSSTSSYYCQFGAAKPTLAIVQSSEILQCLSPPRETAGYENISISVNGIDFVETGLTFAYIATPTIQYSIPSSGSDIGGSLIFIHGSSYGPRDIQYYCEFGSKEFITPAQREASLAAKDRVSCRTPSHILGEVELRLCSNNQFCSESITYVYNPQEMLESIFPVSCFLNGCSSVTISGRNFINTSSLSCKFGTLITPAVFINSTMVECSVPTVQTPTIVSMGVSNNGYDYLASGISFEYLQKPILSSVMPQFAAWNSSTLVDICGTDFLDDSRMQFIIGSSAIRIVSAFPKDGCITCVVDTTAVSEEYTDNPVRISIAIDDSNIFGTDFLFLFHQVPLTDRFQPVSGPESGNWNVYIPIPTSKFRTETFYCRFSHSIVVLAELTQTDSISCLVPKLPVGFSELEISFDSISFYGVGKIQITSMINIVSYSPSSGLLSGGQLINFQYIGANNTAALCCEFDGIIYSSISSNSTHVVCKSPPSISQTTVVVRIVQCDAVTSIASGDQVYSFNYGTTSIRFRSFFPSFGRQSGNTQIMISGENLSPISTSFFCQFSGLGNSTNFKASQLAQYVDDFTISCITPSIAHAQDVRFSVTANLTNAEPLFVSVFSYHADPVFLDLFPKQGLEIGGTLVTLVISASIPLNVLAQQSVSCYFGTLLSTQSVIYKSSSTSNIEIVCLAPPSTPSSVEVYVSMNGVDLLRSGFVFKYLPSPVVESLSSPFVTAQTEIISIFGSEFVSSERVCCNFSNEVVVGATRSDARIDCGVPTSWKMSTVPITATLSISMDCFQYVDTGLSVTFLPTPTDISQSPILGYVDSQTVVIVTGENLYSSSLNTVLCRINNMLIAATRISNNFASCLAPALGSSTVGFNASIIPVPFDLSIDGGNSFFPTSGRSFFYLNRPVIDSISPSTAFEGGLFRVRFKLRQSLSTTGDIDIYSQSVCRVGSVVAPLHIHSSNIVSCIVFLNSVGTYLASLSLNGQDFIEYGRGSISILPKVVFRSLYPSAMFLSQKVDTPLLVSIDMEMSTTLSQYAEFYCIVNGEVFTSSFEFSITDNDTEYELGTITCRIYLQKSGEYNISIKTGQDGVDLLPDFSSLTGFTVFDSPIVSRTYPLIVDNGEPSTICLTGVFDAYPYLRCSFAENSDSTNSYGDSVQLSNSTTICCDYNPSIVPPEKKTRSSGYTTMLIGLSIDATSRPSFISALTVLDAMKVQSVSPNAIATTSNFTITVFGENFIQTPDLTCRIGTDSFTAIVRSVKQVSCLAVNIINVGVYTLSLSANKVDFVTGESAIIQVQPNPVVYTSEQLFCPSTGSVKGLTIAGHGFNDFTNAIKCNYANIAFDPLRVSNSSVTCPCPSLSSLFGTDLLSAEVDMTVSILGSDPSTSLYSSRVLFYQIPSAVLSSNIAIINSPTLVGISFAANWSTSAQCRISGGGISDSKIVSQVNVNGSYLACEVLLKSEVVVQMQLSIDSNYFYDIGYVYGVKQPMIVSVDPAVGTDDGGFDINILVQYNLPYYLTTSNVVCVFETYGPVNPSSLINSMKGDSFYSTVTCATPNRLTVGALDVSIAMFGIISTPSTIAVNTTPLLVTRSPIAFSTELNRNAIEIQVTHDFPVGYNSFCMLNGSRFLSSPQSPSYVSGDSVFVTCDLTAVPLQTGYYELTVGFLKSFAKGVIDVYVDKEMSIQSLCPSVGFLEGGTIVLVTVPSSALTSSKSATQAYCSFDGVETDGIVLDEETIACTTPSAVSPSVSIISVRGDRRRSGKAVTFTYISEVEILNISPSIGSVTGGTLVTVTASILKGFVPFVDYSCVFGNTAVVASYLSSSQIVCVAPASKSSVTTPFSVLVSNSAVSISENMLVFSYYTEPSIRSLSPQSGSLYGGMNISILTNGPVLSSSPFSSGSCWCKFGSVIVEAVITGDDSVVCLTPQTRNVGAVTLEISFNGIDFHSNEDNSISFLFVDTVSVFELLPWHASPKDGRLYQTLTVFGQSFPNRNDISCVFGNPNDANNAVIASIQNATRVSSDQLLCILDLSCSISEGCLSGRSLPLTLRIDSVEYFSGLVFQLDKELTITDLYPKRISISEVNGNMFITVRGSGFADFAEKSCFVGSKTEAFVVSETELLCSIPQDIVPGIVDVSITMNGVDLVYAGYVIVTSGLRITSVWPNLIPSTGYSTLNISSSGLNTAYTYSCNINGYSTMATVVSSTELTCLSSPQLPHSNHNVEIHITCANVSDNGKSNGISLTYYSSPIQFSNISPQSGPSNGGTIVTLTISSPLLSSIVNSDFNVLVKTMDGNIVDAAADLTTNAIVFTTMASEPSHSQFMVSLNGGFDYYSVPFAFTSISDFNSTSISVFPKNVTIGTTTRLFLSSNFTSKLMDTSNLACMVGFETFIATWMSSTLIVCNVRMGQVGKYSFAISYNNQNWLSLDYLQVLNGILLTSLAPKFVPISGGLNVSLFGYKFDVQARYELLLESQDKSVYLTVPVNFISESTLGFQMPSLVGASLNDQTVSVTILSNSGYTNTIDLIVHEEVNILNTSPMLSIVSGGTLLNLTLDSVIPNYVTILVALRVDEDFEADHSLLCMMEVSAKPTVIGSQVLFTTPALKDFMCSPSDFEAIANQSSYHVSAKIVYDNGYSSPSAFFTYLRNPIFTALSINSIDENYNQPIYVFGQNIPNVNMLCKYDGYILNALERTDSYVLCPLPTKLQAGPMLIFLGFSGGDDWILVQEQLLVNSAPLVVSWFPKSVPSVGFSNVSISGLSFNELVAEKSTLFCKFGVLEMPANIVTNQSLSCKTPPKLKPGLYNITVIIRQMEGKLFKTIDSSSPIFIIVYADEYITSLSTSHGPSIGGTTVFIEGQNFIQSNDLVVKFEYNESLAVTVNAEFISQTSIMVTVPANPGGVGSGLATLAVSNNNYDFVKSGIIFYWDKSIVVHSVVPSSVFESTTNTIGIFGEGFVQSFPNMLQCRFGGTLYSEALYIDDKSVQCISPSVKNIERLSIEVTVNGIDFISAGEIDIVPFPQLLSLSPSEVGIYNLKYLVSGNLNVFSFIFLGHMGWKHRGCRIYYT